ncbi:hypothetical protein D3C85_1529690 [compost metagenome]
MHAAVFADQPLQFAVLLGFAKAHHRPGFSAKICRVIVNPDAVPNLVADIVPLRTGHLAGFAAHAGRDINQLGDFGLIVPHTRCGSHGVGRGAFDNVLCFHCH